MSEILRSVWPVVALDGVGDLFDDRRPALVAIAGGCRLGFANPAAAALFAAPVRPGDALALDDRLGERLRRFAGRAAPGEETREILRFREAGRPVLRSVVFRRPIESDDAVVVVVETPASPAGSAVADTRDAALAPFVADGGLAVLFDADGAVLAARGDHHVVDGIDETIETVLAEADDVAVLERTVAAAGRRHDLALVRLGAADDARRLLWIGPDLAASAEPAPRSTPATRRPAPSDDARDDTPKDAANDTADDLGSIDAIPVPPLDTDEDAQPERTPIESATTESTPTEERPTVELRNADAEPVAETAEMPSELVPVESVDEDLFVAAPAFAFFEPAESEAGTAEPEASPPPTASTAAEAERPAVAVPPAPSEPAEASRTAAEDGGPTPATSAHDAGAVPAEPTTTRTEPDEIATDDAETAPSDESVEDAATDVEPEAVVEPEAETAAAIATAPAGPVDAPAEDGPFAPSSRPVKFVWQMDAGQTFTLVSPEFADTVGAAAADLVGRTWGEVALAYDLDRDGAIARAIARRDTWSGRTLLWPVAARALRLPVDIAALPAFGPGREFMGFRGFGSVRTGRAVPDETGLGLRLAGIPVAPEPPLPATPPVEPTSAALAASVPVETETTEAAPPETVSGETVPLHAAAPETGFPETTSTGAVAVEKPVAPEDTATSAAAEAEVSGDTGTVSSEPNADTTEPAPEATEPAPTEREPHAAEAVAADTIATAESRPEPASTETSVPPASAPTATPETTEAPEDILATPPDAPTADAPAAPIATPSSETATARPNATTDAADASRASSRVVALPNLGRLPADAGRLSAPERHAFEQIAAALGVRIEGRDDLPPPRAPAAGSAAAAMPTPAVSPVAATSAPAGSSTGSSTGAPMLEPRVLDRLPIALALVRQERLIHANERFLSLLRYPDFASLAAAGGLDALFAGEHVARRFERSDGGRPAALIARDGTVVPCDVTLTPVATEDGGALLIVLVDAARADAPAAPAAVAPALGPSSQTGASAAASAVTSEPASDRIAELEAIVDTATDGVLMLDADGLVLSANTAAEALFGLERRAMIGRSLTDRLAPESRRSAMDYLDGLARNGVASVLNDGREVIGTAAPEGLIPLFMTIGRISSGPIAKYCAVLRDITQWKKSEEELTTARRRAEEASIHKSDFLAKISHEIRTPLNAIIGFSELMIEERFGPVGNERYRDYLRDIHVSGSHIMSLINDLLDLSKVEAGKMDLRFEAVVLADVVSECVAMMQPQANRDRIIIRSSLPAGVPAVVADPRSIRQVVLNLLSNAIKYTPAGGQVIVSTTLEDDGEVVLRVRDTGYGMSDKEIETALEPFRRLHTTRSRAGGTGLGLPLTKALAEANRAVFRIDSTVGQGTLVSIAFPVTRVLAS